MTTTSDRARAAAADGPVRDHPVPPGRRSRWRAGVVAERAALLVLCLIGWELFTRWIDNPMLPGLDDLWRTGVDTVGSADYWQAVLTTLAAWGLGLTLSILIAVPVGLVVGSSRVVNRFTRSTFDFLRTVPLIMLVPLLVLMLGTTIKMKLVVVVLSAFWPIMLQTSYGIREVDKVAKETVRSYGIRWIDRVRYLFLPSAAPLAATGVRIAATTGLLVTIGAELVTSAPGVGYEITLTQANAEPARSFVFVLTAGVLGLLINSVFHRVERTAMFWHPSQRRHRRTPTRGAGR